jgi:hypothetical protein
MAGKISQESLGGSGLRDVGFSRERFKTKDGSPYMEESVITMCVMLAEFPLRPRQKIRSVFSKCWTLSPSDDLQMISVGTSVQWFP